VNGRMVTNQWDFTTAGAGGSALPPTQTFHSAWVDQSAYPALAQGATRKVTVRFRNTGTATWQRGVFGKQVTLGINGDLGTFAALGMNVDWPTADRVAVQSESTVVPGATATFAFTVRAPAQPGVYRLPLRPVVDGVSWLEDQGVFMVVTSQAAYHSAWLSQSAYPTLRPGETSAPLTISFKNTGTAQWTRGAFGQQANLGVNGDNRTWAGLGVGWPTPDRVAIQGEAVVPAGGVATFTFQIRAPSAPGTYAIHLRPVIDGLTWLEDEGVFLYVTVR